MMQNSTPNAVKGVPPGDRRLVGSLRISSFLSDSLLGFLALLAAELALAPVLLDIPEKPARFLEGLQWAIIGVFALEYVTSLIASPDRKQFVFGPWRLLDLLIIFVPLVSLLPNVANGLRSTPVLRLLRLLRLASFAARARGSVIRQKNHRKIAAESGPPKVALLSQSAPPEVRHVSWEDFATWVAKPQGSWCHVSNISSPYFDAVARVEGLSRPLLESCLSAANYPRLEASHRGVVLSLWLPGAQDGSRPTSERSSVLLVAGSTALLTVAPQLQELPSVLLAQVQADAHLTGSFPSRLAVALLKLVLRRNGDIADRLEQELRALEEVPVRDSKPDFFEKAFRLRKELSAAKSDLWRLKGILASLTEGRIRFPGKSEQDPVESLRSLGDQADYLYQTVDNLREGLLSVIELHLNVVSFEMNKFMRLLAVVSVLGLVPAVVGGLLGMNLAGNPWPATLSEVTYGVCAAVLLVVYLFLIRGWLR